MSMTRAAVHRVVAVVVSPPPLLFLLEKKAFRTSLVGNVARRKSFAAAVAHASTKISWVANTKAFNVIVARVKNKRMATMGYFHNRFKCVPRRTLIARRAATSCLSRIFRASSDSGHSGKSNESVFCSLLSIKIVPPFVGLTSMSESILTACLRTPLASGE